MAALVALVVRAVLAPVVLALVATLPVRQLSTTAT